MFPTIRGVPRAPGGVGQLSGVHLGGAKCKTAVLRPTAGSTGETYVLRVGRRRTGDGKE